MSDLFDGTKRIGEDICFDNLVDFSAEDEVASSVIRDASSEGTSTQAGLQTRSLQSAVDNYASAMNQSAIDKSTGLSVKYIISSPCNKRKGKNQNDPMRFVKSTAVTNDGEIVEKKVYEIDEEQIAKEELYDGFYTVMTNLEGNIEEIIKINK